jgi:Oxidoreductase molybdopterin binding domain
MLADLKPRVIALLLLAGPCAAAPAPLLLIKGLSGQTAALEAADLKAMARVSLDHRAENGASAPYAGVRLTDLLGRVGAPMGPALRGPALADVVIVKASDGYRVAFSLGELDPGVGDELVVLADQKAGQPLTPPEGPLRLIVAGDKRGARAVRGVVEIDVEAAP